MSRPVSAIGSGAMLGANIAGRLERLAQCSDTPGAVTRLYLSPSHRAAIDLVSGWMRDAGMAVRLDAAGSVIGRYEGLEGGAPTLLMGSHIDSVPNAGRFDGNLGVVSAIEVVGDLKSAGRRLPFAIEVVAFGDEEGSRFPSTLGGSRALAGAFQSASLEETDVHGVSRRDALIAFGCDPDAIDREVRDPAHHIGYVELHIEQGPVLEAEKLAVGVVSAINGASRGTIEVRGEAGHAGTVPMAMRRDALAAAAEIALAIEARARRETELVATVGRVEIDSAAVNSVPGLVRMSLDIRSPSDELRHSALADIERAIAAIGERRGVTARLDITYDAAATPCDERLSVLLEKAVADLGVRPLRLPSGAGHDAMSFRGRLPIAMVFVRCRAGVSHSPAEHASIEDIIAGARTLAAFVEKLALAPVATARQR